MKIAARVFRFSQAITALAMRFLARLTSPARIDSASRLLEGRASDF
jgi:hypothetical protein